jgi:hypothetical protein
MIRTLFAGLGVSFMLMLVFCSSFLGRLAYQQTRQRAAHEHLAIEITRELAQAWSVKDIRQRYARAVGPKLSSADAQTPFDALKPLGPFRYASETNVETGWSRGRLRQVTSPAAAAELLAELLSKTVRVSFLAKFANGLANVTIELRNEGGAMRLWHLRIDSREPLRSAPRRQAISHA